MSYTQRNPRQLYGRAPAAKPAPLTTLSAMPAGPGAVGTAANPSPAAPNNAPATPMTRTQQRPNSGGNIQRNGKLVSYTPPDPTYTGASTTPQSGGYATAGGRTVSSPTSPGYKGPLPIGPDGKPGAVPANRPPQTERDNPLVNGGGPPQLEGTSVAVTPPAPPPTIDPGKALGISRRGTRTPAGQDLPNPAAVATDPNAQPASPDESSVGDDLAKVRQGVQSDLAGQTHVGGYGQYAKNFSSPTAANIYDSQVRSLFGGPTPKGAASSAASRANDNSNDDQEA